ncbi:MAG: hypothetical protein SGILL_009992 [Bacillariaceae sp.]
MTPSNDTTMQQQQSTGQATQESYAYDDEDEYSFHDDEEYDSDATMTREEEFESSIVHPKMDVIGSLASKDLSEEEAKVEDDGWAPPEGEGACFSTYATRCRHLSTDPFGPFRKFCQSTDFSEFVKECGVGVVGFTPNQYLYEGVNVYDRFVKLLGTKPTRYEDILDNACLSIVFHGTATRNIQDILNNGLDPSRRSGQAYGPGEYFSKDPTVSVSYCKGDSAMLVFLVVVPPKDKQAKKLPMDYVVVNENSHQLPLGVLNFGKVDSTALARANEMRNRLRQLNSDIERLRAGAMDAQTKAYIIQLLIQEKTDLAIEKYEKHHSTMKKESLMEISMYVHEKFDADLATCLFPDLPEPFKAEEFAARADLSTVENRKKEIVEAKSKLELVRKGVAQKYF